jgi:hypothetical protein
MKPALKQEYDGLHIVGVQSAQMMAVWPHVSKYFASFEERSRGSAKAGDLLFQCIKAERQCWVATDGAEIKACALTEIQTGPMKVVLLTFCAGDDMDDWWPEMVATIKAWAKHIGAGRLTAIHRPGWEKFLKRAGFTKTHVISEVDIA